jgi:hypothetical protein
MRVLRLFLLVMTCLVAPLALSAATEPAPDKVRELLQILSDPEVKNWIEQQRAAPVAVVAARVAADEAMMAGQIDGIRAHLASIGAAVPRVRGALAEAAAKVHGEMASHGFDHFFLLLAGFAALGFGLERLFWLISGGVRRWIVASPMDTPGERLRAMFA